MTAFFELVLSGFWAFVGSFLLLAMLGSIAVRLIVGSMAALRGGVVNFGRRIEVRTKPEDVVNAVRNAIDSGDLDGPISRVIARNKRRTG